MSFTVWFWIWLVLAMLLAIAEIFTTGLFMLPFALGAAVAALLAVSGMALAWQLAAYFVVSAIAFVVLRLYVQRWQNAPTSMTGGNRLIGRPGIVISEIDDEHNRGMVRVEREEWRADAPGAGRLAEGTAIVVVAVEGTHLIVRPGGVDAAEEL